MTEKKFRMTEKTFNKWFNTFILVGMAVVTVVVTAIRFQDAENGRAMLVFSAFGSLMGVLSTVCAANGRILTFLFGLIDVSIYGVMCLIGTRYGNGPCTCCISCPCSSSAISSGKDAGPTTRRK